MHTEDFVVFLGGMFYKVAPVLGIHFNFSGLTL